MKFDFIKKIEEKIVFRTSHIFFLSLVGVVLLAMALSALLLLWGLTPSLKPGVDKAEYPPPVTVTLDEITAQLPAAEKDKGKKVEKKSGPAKSKPEAAASGKNLKADTKVDSTKILYEKQIARMKELLPPKKYLWSDKGHRDYWNRWIVDRYGIQSRLNSRFRAIGATSHAEKNRLLEKYIAIINLFKEKQRYPVLKDLLYYTRGNTDMSVRNMELLAEATRFFPRENTAFLTRLARFGKKNPRDGQSFIAHVNRVMPKFYPSERGKVLENMIAAYYRHYNNNIEGQKQATERFLPMLTKLGKKHQARALTVFYDTFEKKNARWRDEIANIDRQYEYDLSNAEMTLREKQAAKAEYRSWALMGLGGGIVFIALVALVLSLLSIQRNMAELKELVSRPADRVAPSPRENAIKVKTTI